MKPSKIRYKYNVTLTSKQCRREDINCLFTILCFSSGTFAIAVIQLAAETAAWAGTPSLNWLRTDAITFCKQDKNMSWKIPSWAKGWQKTP